MMMTMIHILYLSIRQDFLDDESDEKDESEESTRSDNKVVHVMKYMEGTSYTPVLKM